MIETVLFWGLAAVAVASALAVVALRKPADSVMALLVLMIAIAGLFALMGAYVVALFQVIVYIGAVLVLFLFVVMLLNAKGTARTMKPGLAGLAAGTAGVGLTAGAVWLAWKGFLSSGLPLRGEGALPAPPDVTALATELFTRHILVFELTSVLLFAAAVGAVYVTRKERNRP